MSQAIYLLANRDESYQFKTGAEVLKVTLPVLPLTPNSTSPMSSGFDGSCSFLNQCSLAWPQLLAYSLDSGLGLASVPGP